jgi:hypothetical protein
MKTVFSRIRGQAKRGAALERNAPSFRAGSYFIALLYG